LWRIIVLTAYTGLIAGGTSLSAEASPAEAYTRGELEDRHVGEKPTDADESKTNMQDFEKREAEDSGGSSPTPSETANLNLSKSNINRQAAPALTTSEIGNPLEPASRAVAGGAIDPTPAEASTVKGSKSNSSE
jgi:hypothetical protein